MDLQTCLCYRRADVYELAKEDYDCKIEIMIRCLMMCHEIIPTKYNQKQAYRADRVM